MALDDKLKVEMIPEYSMGTAPIYRTLKEIYSGTNPMYDTIMINLGTILRNCSSNKSVIDAKKEDKLLHRKSNAPAHILIKEGKAEIMKFVEAVCSLMRENETVLFPSIIVYFVDYKKCIPSHVYKPFTESEREMALAETMLQGIVHGSRKDAKVDRVNFVELPIVSKLFPHRLLAKELAAIKSNHHVIMISNHKLDYHIHKYCSRFCLIDSFTGRIIEARDLSEKVFSNKELPFIPSLHALLGDNVDIKASITGKEKKNLIETATTNRWSTHTSEYVDAALRSLRVSVPFEI